MDEEKYLRRALRLAKKGRGRVNPNPLVGAVIVKDGQIVGEGYHQYFGGPHAEINALDKAGLRARGATLYVNLEPCCHYGKTAPCVDAIIQAGIKKVVVGCIDPNPLINGKGIACLRDKNIDVQVGLLQHQCEQLNQGYFKYITTGKPLVTVHIAQSLDGRIATATGDSQWISSFPSRKVSHRFRGDNNAILVGINTVLIDDPRLTVRHIRGSDPLRIVLDSKLRIPETATLLSEPFIKKTVLATTKQASEDKIRAFEKKGVRVWTLPTNSKGQVDLNALLCKLGNEGITSLLVEGGGQVITSILKAGLADKIVVFISPIILGKGIEAVADLEIKRVDQALRVLNPRIRKVGPDCMITGDVSKAN